MMSNDNKPSKLDMDIINMVQNARMMHDDTAIPSKVPGVYWIEAKNPTPAQQLSPRIGEFQIQTVVDKVDEQWQIIKQATEAGQLGYKSKISTASTDGSPHSEQRLICIRTYDADDRADIARVEHQLKDLGFTNLIYVVI